MTFRDVLTGTGRRRSSGDDPLVVKLFEFVLSKLALPQPLTVVHVDSACSIISIDNYGTEAYLVWDWRYVKRLRALLSAAILSPLPESLHLTESILIQYLRDFTVDRGREDVAEELLKHKPMDWRYLIDRTARTRPIDRLSIALENILGIADTGPVFGDFSEAESFLKQQIRVSPEQLQQMLDTQVTTMQMFIFLHEVAHHVLRHDRSRRARYENELDFVFKKHECHRDWWPDNHYLILPVGVIYERDPGGGFRLSTRATFYGDVLPELCLEWASTPGVKDEIYCDWFAIDTLANLIVPPKSSQLQFAEIEQALWLCHQYQKSLAYYRHDLLGLMGEDHPDRTRIVSEKHARGVLQHVRIRQLMHRKVTAERRKQIADHREGIRWLDVLFIERQEKVLSRFANHPEDLF